MINVLSDAFSSDISTTDMMHFGVFLLVIGVVVGIVYALPMIPPLFKNIFFAILGIFGLIVTLKFFHMW